MNIGLQDSCKTAAIVQSWCGCPGPNVKSLHRTQNAWLCLAIVSKWTVSSCAFKSICLLSPSLDSTNWPNMDSADSDTVHTALRAQSNQIHNKERFTSVVQEIQGISSLHQGFHSSVGDQLQLLSVQMENRGATRFSRGLRKLPILPGPVWLHLEL